MNKEFNYISDEVLEQLINQVEQKELVAAPPDLMERILEAVGLEGELPKESVQYSEPVETKVLPVNSRTARKKEFYGYCFRVITSVAAAVALVFLLPELMGQMEQNASSPEQSPVIRQQEVPSYEEVVDTVPDREEVVTAMRTPSKEEVLDDTGIIKRVLDNTGWFNKQNSEK